MSLPSPEETSLTNLVRAVAKNLVDGDDVCDSVGDLATRIDKDSGKKNRLTTAQADRLLAVVDKVSSAVRCSGGAH